MLKIKEYVKAESLEQAYELNQKRTNCILGGMLWLKMSNRNVQKAIDLSGLGLNQIEETEEEFRIGCMTTLRELECHERLNQWCEGAVKDAVSDIVGVQFRNLATIGGSIFGRYGFSDVLTVFLAMDSYVELYKGGIVPLQEFAQMKRDNDILVRVIVKKDQRNMIYLAHRNSKTDFPVLTCAVSVNAENGCVCIGARPQKAVRLELTEAVREKVWSGVCTEEEMKKEAECIASQVKTDSNMRAGKEYRSRLAYVLIRRTLEALNTKPEERKWLGDPDYGWCPNCHSNSLCLGEPQWKGLQYPIECTVCGAGGDLERTPDGKWKFVIAANGLERDRTTEEGRGVHCDEIAETQGGFFMDPKKREEVAAKLPKYKELKFPELD